MDAPKAFPCMGGIETHVHEVSRALAALGYAVMVLSTGPTGALPVREDHDGVRMIRVSS
jgi:dienelactone hydrolase